GIEYLERARYTVIVNRRPLMDHREAVARLQHGPDLPRLPRNVRYGQEAYLIPGRRDPVSRRRVDPLHRRAGGVLGPLDRIARGVVRRDAYPERVSRPALLAAAGHVESKRRERREFLGFRQAGFAPCLRREQRRNEPRSTSHDA